MGQGCGDKDDERSRNKICDARCAVARDEGEVEVERVATFRVTRVYFAFSCIVKGSVAL